MLPTPSPLNQPLMSHSHLMPSTCKTKCLHLPLQSRPLGCVHLFHWVTQPLLHHLRQKPACHPGQLPPWPHKPCHQELMVLPHALRSPQPHLHISTNSHHILPGQPQESPAWSFQVCFPSQPILHTAARETNNKQHNTSFLHSKLARPSHYREYTLHMPNYDLQGPTHPAPN